MVEFSYEEDLTNYMLANEFDVDDDELEGFFGEGDNTIKLKSPGGEIIDIKVYVNDKMKSDPQLIKLHKALVSRMEDIHHRLLKGKKDKYSQLTASDNLDTTFYRIGGHKTKGQEFRGIRVSYFIKSPKPLRVGDETSLVT